MTAERPKRHVCPELDEAIAAGFVREEGERMMLADLVSQGAQGSQYARRLYGPAIAFCPFCGAFFGER